MHETVMHDHASPDGRNGQWEWDLTARFFVEKVEENVTPMIAPFPLTRVLSAITSRARSYMDFLSLQSSSLYSFQGLLRWKGHP